MGSAPDSVKRLVDRFDQNRKARPERSRRVFLSPDYKEEQLRAESLNPFFTALGWDMGGRRSCDSSRHQVVDGRQMSLSSLWS